MIRQRESLTASPTQEEQLLSASRTTIIEDDSAVSKYRGSTTMTLQRPSLFYVLLGAMIGIMGYATWTHENVRCHLDTALLYTAVTTPKNPNNSRNHMNNNNNGIVVSIQTPPQYYAYQPDYMTMKASKKLFTKMPKRARRTFYSHMSKICQPMVRALRDQGWTQVYDEHDAQLIYTYDRKKSWYHTLKSWQRYNHIPHTEVWNTKDRFATGFRRWEERTGHKAYFVPETFDLDDSNQVARFKTRLYQEGGLEYPWVLKIPNKNQGKGVFMLGPQSEELKQVFQTVADGKGVTRYIIQQYICNEMTWNRRKFDVRVFWLVASLDPLIVFYIDGYARIGNAEYNESDFSNTRQHLTTHTFLGEEGKGSYDELNDRILEHVAENPALQARIADPVSHVRNQFKESIGMLVDAFKGETFRKDHGLHPEDAFEFYGADCVIDNDLDVWMIEAQDDTGLDEDHYFRLDMHHQIFYGMGLVLTEIWDKQAKGLPILPLKNTGKWEMVYADGWRFESPDGYERDKNKKGCEVNK